MSEREPVGGWPPEAVEPTDESIEQRAREWLDRVADESPDDVGVCGE